MPGHSTLNDHSFSKNMLKYITRHNNMRKLFDREKWDKLVIYW